MIAVAAIYMMNGMVKIVNFFMKSLVYEHEKWLKIPTLATQIQIPIKNKDQLKET